MLTTIPSPSSTDYTHHVTNFLASQPINPLIVKDIDNSQACFFFQHDNVKDGSTNAYHLMKNLNGCHVCAKRYAKTYAISDMDDSIYKCFNKIDKNFFQSSDYKKLSRHSTKSCSEQSIIGLIMLDRDTLFNLDLIVGGYGHITRSINSEYRINVKPARAQLIIDAIPRYVTSGLFDRFLTRLILQGKDSLDLMKSCLDKAEYGTTFIPAVNWCFSVLTDLSTHTRQWHHFSQKQKIAFALHHIIRAGLSNDFRGTIALLFQTSNDNIIGLLEDAKSDSAMTAMCNYRLHPQRYQRPTADASVGQITNAIKYLGDFKNTILTDIRAKELIPEIAWHGQNITDQVDTTSSLSGFAAQLAKTQISKTTTSFASRCGESSITIKINNIRNVTDFVKFSRDHPDIRVEISLDSGPVVYVAETTLDKEKIKHRHLWAYLNGRSKSDFGMIDSWLPVSCTIPMYEYIFGHKNVLFVIRENKHASKYGNCCFPEFLTSAYHGICSTAYEGLNSTTEIDVPDERLMVGIGSSAVSENKLSSPIRLRINNITVVLTNLY